MSYSTARESFPGYLTRHHPTMSPAHRHHATTVPLTGEEFAGATERAMQRVEHHGGQLGLILFSLDNLPELYARVGRDSGDALLEHLSLHLARRIRADDLLGRVAHEEFALLTPGMELTEVTGCAVKLRHLISDFHFNRIGPVCASFGVTHFLPGESLPAVECRARSALNRARAAGGNRVNAVRAIA